LRAAFVAASSASSFALASSYSFNFAASSLVLRSLASFSLAYSVSFFALSFAYFSLSVLISSSLKSLYLFLAGSKGSVSSSSSSSSIYPFLLCFFSTFLSLILLDLIFY
jgi:hypothetical protein